MSTVDDRAELIYGYLRGRLGQGLTITQLCRRLNLQPGSKTAAAIRRARDMATADGLHFPPAVPANQFTYRVTELAEDALDPSMHMERIATGVRARADVGWEFMRRHQANLPDDLRPTAAAVIALREEARRSQAATQRILDDLIAGMIKTRRAERQEENHS